MTRTLAVVVGVGKYRAPLISDLPGCASDGRRVQQSLIAWGVLRENIKLLLDEEATRKNVLHALRVWPLEIPDPALRMLFFFSGHGRRICESGRPDRSVLLTHDTEVSDMAGTALTLTVNFVSDPTFLR